MKKFKVCANNIEYLLKIEIEASNSEEAVDKFIEMWENGDIFVNESELVDFQTEEIL